MKLTEWFWLITLVFVVVVVIALAEYLWPVDYRELAEIWGSIWV